MSLKNPVTPPGIDHGTVRLVAQRLNQYGTQAPIPHHRIIKCKTATWAFFPTSIHALVRDSTVFTGGKWKSRRQKGTQIWVDSWGVVCVHSERRRGLLPFFLPCRCILLRNTSAHLALHIFKIKYTNFKFLKPTTRFNIQKFYVVITWNFCFVWISEQTTNFALRNIKRLVFITEVESVYCSVRTESLYNTDTFRL